MSRTSGIVALVGLLLGSPPVARADVVQEWNAIMLATVSGQNPFAQARFAAITHVAVFEAVNAITGEYEPYLGTIAAPPWASPDAAAVAAAHAVLVHYFSAHTGVLDAARDTSLAAIPDGQPKTHGIAVGRAAAAAIIALRENDGSGGSPVADPFPPRSSSPGEWQLTPGCPAAGSGVFYHWRNVTPFGLQSSSHFRSGPPPALTSNKYAKDYKEVKAVGALDSVLRPADRAHVVAFYQALLAVGVWNQVARQLAAAHGSSLAENARAFALINMALSDALVTVMETKYYYAFWRPETAIRAGDADGNPKTEPDIDFSPFMSSLPGSLGITPCFPSYPSAHATASYAARRVVQEVWGAAGHSIDLIALIPPSEILTLYYTSLKQITDDIDDARVYGGIHFRFDQEAGARQGWRIGGYVHGNLLRPAQF
jgi:hypothetical protein